MSKVIKYEVSSGSLYIQPLTFDTLKEAEAYYEEEKQYRKGSHITISKIIKETIKEEWIP